ncbi:hypothetical protein LDENG_00084780 [Lucifuga dentata]|nr:hypothetical protein LDENG_00084780 [Lucifuga dentata]
MREFSRVFLPILYSLVFILGFIGNGLVVCVLVKHRNQTNMTDICLFNLALSDLVFVLSLPLFCHYAAISQWVFGDFICHFSSGLHNLGFFSSIFFMVVMTLDRYVLIMHTHTVARHRTLKVGAALAVVVWMLSLCISLPNFIFTKVKNESSELTCDYDSESANWKLYNLITMNILGLVIPLLVMIVCYSRIIPTLVNMRSAKKHRVVKLIVTIVVVFFFFWTPCNIILVLKYLHDQGILFRTCNSQANIILSEKVTEAVAFTHCCLNPIIYAFVGQKFMHRVLRLLRKWLPSSLLLSSRDFSESSNRQSSVTSRSSDVTSTFIIYTLRSSDCGRQCNMNSTEYPYLYEDWEEDSLPLSDGSMFLPILLYTLSFLGLLGNITVLWVLLSYMKLKTMTDVCLLNLALSDLILALSLALWAYTSHTHQELSGDLPCKLMTGIYQLGLYSGTLFVTLMSVDRYLAIVHAVAAMQARTLCYGTAASVAIWVTSVTMATPQMTFAAIHIDGDDNSTLKCQQVYPQESERLWKMLRNFSENIVGLFICLPVLTFCYVKILIVLQNSRNSNKHKAIKMIFTIVCVFVVCWVPYNLIVFLQTLQLFNILNNREASKTIGSAIGVAETIALSHCCINPVIYAFVGEKFRKSLRHALPKSLCWYQQVRGASSDFSHRDTTDKETSNTPVRSDY